MAKTASLLVGSAGMLAASYPALAHAAPDWSAAETIVVTGTGTSSAGSGFETRHTLGPGAVRRIDAASADEVVRRLPGVQVPVNSRGEAIAFVRNAGERQVAVFYEGADINVPWDNRLDLSMLPAGLVGRARMAAGPLAPHYGVNALAALSLSPGQGLRGRIAYGTADRLDAELAVPLGKFEVGGSYSRRDGDPLSDKADLPYSQAGRRLRTNTDRELGSVFARFGAQAGVHALSLTAFHVDAQKGIAPESHIASGARFWRYPELSHSLVVGSVRSALGAGSELDSALWYQAFGQTIDSYTGADYATVDTRQVDRDRTWGLRELLKHQAGPLLLVGSFNVLQSTHRQRDMPHAGGSPPTMGPEPLLYRQRNWSVGGEIEYQLSEALRAEIGAGYDVVEYVRTGDKPSVPDVDSWTGRAALALDAGRGWRLRAAIGRKMRAPTMRERFGEAINRFLPAPDLNPERIVTGELGVEWQGNGGGFYLIPFYQDLDGTIDQRRVGSRRQRINLVGSKVAGVDAGARWQPLANLSLAGDATWTRVRRKQPGSVQANRIAEKPAVIANATAEYQAAKGASLLLEVQHLGRAWSVGGEGDLVRLPRSTSVNARVAQAVALGERSFEVFAHAYNIADVAVLPQSGLPAPGRALMFGLRFN
jgi:iron complex outermembrane recepter protein